MDDGTRSILVPARPAGLSALQWEQVFTQRRGQLVLQWESLPAYVREVLYAYREEGLLNGFVLETKLMKAERGRNRQRCLALRVS